MKLHIERNLLLILASAALLFSFTARQLRAQSAPKDAAMPNATAADTPPQHQHDGGVPGMNHDGSMPGMNMEDDAGHHAQTGVMQSMTHHHHMDGAHMRMTPDRPATAEDLRRAEEISANLAKAIERYRDYRVALADGFHIFMPNLPQAQYHFTNYWNGYLEGFTFDPARPTSLLYTKTKDGYELIGAMYTAPKTASLEELNERVPLGVARWHQHTNLCMPPRGAGTHADWKSFGLMGSISTEEECQEAGGRFYPVIFGWMVHVYPFESTSAKVWAQ